MINFNFNSSSSSSSTNHTSSMTANELVTSTSNFIYNTSRIGVYFDDANVQFEQGSLSEWNSIVYSFLHTRFPHMHVVNYDKHMKLDHVIYLTHLNLNEPTCVNKVYLFVTNLLLEKPGFAIDQTHVLNLNWFSGAHTFPYENRQCHYINKPECMTISLNVGEIKMKDHPDFNKYVFPEDIINNKQFNILEELLAITPV